MPSKIRKSAKISTPTSTVSSNFNTKIKNAEFDVYFASIEVFAHTGVSGLFAILMDLMDLKSASKPEIFVIRIECYIFCCCSY